METKTSGDTTESSIYNLFAALYTPETLFEERIDTDRWVLFVPDFEGYPVLINDRLHGYLDSFRSGAIVSDVVAKDGDFLTALSGISALEERGFLREIPVMMPYKTPPPRRKPKDFSVWLHITNSCNLKCAYCFVGEKTSEGMSREVMEKVARDIASTANSYGTEQVDIKFAGGEPTLSVPRMAQFRSILLEQMCNSESKVRFAVLSNGTLVNDKLLSFLKETGTGISISLDGFGEAHDTYRVFASGHGSWKIVSQNIEKLCKNGIKPYIMATISQETCHSLPDLVKWLYKNGLRYRLSVVRNPGSSWAGGDRRKEYEAMNTKLAEAFDRAFTVLEDPSVLFDLRAGLDICELYFDRPTQGVPCGIGQNHIVIKPDGTLVSCPMTIAEKGLHSSGDLFDTTSKTFVHAPSDRHYIHEEDNCLHCKWFGVCSGGCPITNLRIKGYAFTRSPLCSFYRAVIPRYLRFFGKKLLQAEQRGAIKPQISPVTQGDDLIAD